MILLKDLSKSEFANLLYRINNMKFNFRYSINLPSNITFGNEIEVNGISFSEANEMVDFFNMDHCLTSEYCFDTTEDISVDSEIVTPIMFDNIEYWNNFQHMYDLINSYGARIGDNTSSHVHLGTHCLKSIRDLSLFIKTLVVFEPIIFKFGYGYGDKPRSYIIAKGNFSIYSMFMTPKRVIDFCNILDKSNLTRDEFIEGFNNFINEDFHYRPVFNFNGINYEKYFNSDFGFEYNDLDHMEVRCFNGTLDAEIAQNNISLVSHVLSAVCEGLIDEDYINREYLKYSMNTYNFDCYRAVLDASTEVPYYNAILKSFNNVDMDKAIKLADMIFYDDINKYYFLKQYLKLFNSSDEYVFSLI